MHRWKTRSVGVLGCFGAPTTSIPFPYTGEMGRTLRTLFPPMFTLTAEKRRRRPPAGGFSLVLGGRVGGCAAAARQSAERLQHGGAVGVGLFGEDVRGGEPFRAAHSVPHSVSPRTLDIDLVVLFVGGPDRLEDGSGVSLVLVLRKV